MLRHALRQTAANARQLCLKQQVSGQSNVISSQVCKQQPYTSVSLHRQCSSVYTPQATSVAQETVVVSACRALCSHSSSAHYFSTKAEQQQADETTAQEASGSSQEQAADAEQDAVDPRDQLLAERDQQVCLAELWQATEACLSQGTIHVALLQSVK